MTPKKKLMVHYMPWYISKEYTGYWGWHWTMNQYNPDEIRNGKSSIASHYSPLIGLYDSNDPDTLEYHILLMKLAGIDGIIIDWYGIADFYDYAIINQNTQHIIEYIKKSGMEFAICYEDQSIKYMVNDGYISKEKAVNYGQDVMRWLQENLFNSESYVKLDSRPALFIFGPQYFQDDQWDQIFSVLSSRPFLYTLNNLQKYADGIFGWPPMYGKPKNHEQWHNYLTELYAQNPDSMSCVGAIFPQFHDIYEEAGIHKSYGYIDPSGTKTFEETLDLAIKSNCELMQIVTWNDYGEGTMIEPTKEFGYTYLEILQKCRKLHFDKSFPYTSEDLRLPVILYQLKKKYQHDKSVMADLSKCSEFLFSGKMSDARNLLKQYQEF